MVINRTLKDSAHLSKMFICLSKILIRLINTSFEGKKKPALKRASV